MKSPDTKYDLSYSFETPEGVDLHVELAGPVVRFLAFTIDFFIRIAFLIVLRIVLSILGLGNVGTAFWLLIAFLLEWLYPVFFEMFRHGATPGKKSMGIMVINDDLTPVNLASSLTRNLLRAADFLPFCYAFGLISMTLHSKFQRLGDIAAGTLVIHQTPQQLRPTIPDVSPVAPPFELNADEQAAIVEFALRHNELSESRQQELAGILEAPMHKNSQTILGYLKGIGAWLLGARH